MADRQPPVLLLLGHADGLAADRRSHDGADGLDGVRGLLEEGGIGWLEFKSIGQRKPRFCMETLKIIPIFEPMLQHRISFRSHSVIDPFPMGDPVPLLGTAIDPMNGPTGHCVSVNVQVNPTPFAVAVIVPFVARLIT
jgi:hypothetical protein